MNGLMTATYRPLKFWVMVVVFGAIVSCGTTPTQQSDPVSRGGIALMTENHQAQFKKATASMEAGQFAKAELVFEQLQVAYPSILELPVNLAISQYQQGQYPAAKTTIAAILQKDSSVAQAYNLQGLILQKEGQFEQAKQAFEKAIDRKGQYAEALYNLALLYDVYLQDIAKAVTYYNQYLAIVGEDEATQGWVDQLSSSLQ